MTTSSNERPLLDLLRPLHEDVLFCVDQFEHDDSPFWRRALVRAQFAEMEAAVHSMKQMAFEMSRRKGTKFTVAEKLVLLEKTYELDDSGRAKEFRIKLQLARNIRFAFHAFAKAHFAEFDLKVDGSGWSAFRTLTKVRDRITHPRKPSDLVITDAELKMINDVLAWYNESVLELLAVSQQALRQKLGSFDPDGDPIVPNAT